MAESRVNAANIVSGYVGSRKDLVLTALHSDEEREEYDWCGILTVNVVRWMRICEGFNGDFWCGDIW